MTGIIRNFDASAVDTLVDFDEVFVSFLQHTGARSTSAIEIRLPLNLYARLCITAGLDDVRFFCGAKVKRHGKYGQRGSMVYFKERDV